MNCDSFQDLLFEYLDGSLAAARRAAAEAHLASCPVCRQVMQRNRELAQSLSGRFKRDTESLLLDPSVQRCLVAARGQTSKGSQPQKRSEKHGPFFGWWRRLAWPATIAAGLVGAAFLMTGFPFGGRRPAIQNANLPAMGSVGPVLIQLSECIPVYTFQSEGDLVLDSLSCNPRVVNQTLWLSRNEKSTATKPETKFPL